MDKFLQLLEESVIVQACITLLVVATWCVMVATGQTPPDALTQVVLLVLGFYFGSKAQQTINSRTRSSKTGK